MRGVACSLMLLLAGCGGGGARPATAPLAADDGIPLNTLPRQNLAAGQCGLFLWKAGNEARLVLMAQVQPAMARIALDGRLVDLPRINAQAGDTGGLFADAIYSDGGTTVALNIRLEQRSGLEGGAVVTDGTLRLDRANGDGFVMPVAGLLACR